MLDLKPDQNVLDLGCGIGGSTFYMTEVGGKGGKVVSCKK